MLDLARHIVETKSGDLEPEKFEDRYENALVELLNQKRKGEPIRAAVKPRDTGNVVNLMDALRKSLSDVGKGASSQTAKGRKPRKAASGQREMLMAIAGKGKGRARQRLAPRRPSVRYASARRVSRQFVRTEEVSIRQPFKARTSEELMALLSAVATAILAVIIIMMLYFGREIIICGFR